MRRQENEENRVMKNFMISNIVRIMKARRMRWAGHVARMGEKREGGH
jgi:hypothetical protein